MYTLKFYVFILEVEFWIRNENKALKFKLLSDLKPRNFREYFLLLSLNISYHLKLMLAISA